MYLADLSINKNFTAWYFTFCVINNWKPFVGIFKNTKNNRKLNMFYYQINSLKIALLVREDQLRINITLYFKKLVVHVFKFLCYQNCLIENKRNVNVS